MEMEIVKATRCGTVLRVLNRKLSTSSLATSLSSSIAVAVAVAVAASMVKIEMEAGKIQNGAEQRVK